MVLSRGNGGTLKVTREKTENNQAFLTVEVEDAEMEASLEESYRHLVKRTSVPGFRSKKPGFLYHPNVEYGYTLASYSKADKLEGLICHHAMRAVMPVSFSG